MPTVFMRSFTAIKRPVNKSEYGLVEVGPSVMVVTVMDQAKLAIMNENDYHYYIDSKTILWRL